MGINQQVLKLLLQENNYRHLRGEVLLIGKSTVAVEPKKISALFSEHGYEAPSLSKIDQATRHSSNKFYIDDCELYQSLSSTISAIDILDVSPYEGANIICDMNHPVPQHLVGKYDFIYDSSVLDNVFNPAQFIVNVATMLKPKGRALLINVASFFPGAFTSVHPEWMYGFFAHNLFHDCKVYLTEQTSKGANRFSCETDLWIYSPSYTRNPDYDYFKAVQRTNGICYTLTIVEKQELLPGRGDFPRFPINLQYIHSSNMSGADWTRHIFNQDRPTIQGEYFKDPAPAPPHYTDHYTYLGSGF